MSLTERGIKVHTIPDQITRSKEQALLRILAKGGSKGRPCFVLDCGAIREVNNETTHLLLSCLEEVLRNNGDLRLAALDPDAIASLQATGIDRLFEIYSTVDEAVHSYRERPSSMAPHLLGDEARSRNSKDAA